MNCFDPILLYGIPQSSVLGPLFFPGYTRPLGIIAHRYGVNYHLYAGYTQLYISLDSENELHFSSSLKIIDIVLLTFGNG